MLKAKQRFIEVMRIELEDLHDDIDALLKHCDEALHEHTLTELGYFGNLRVLRSELRGVGFFSRMLDETDPEKYETLKALMDDLEKRLVEGVRKYCMVPAVDRLIRRKIEKAVKYVVED